MKIYKTTKQELELALAELNKKYNGNVRFRRLDPVNAGQTTFTVTLTVNNSRAKGGRVSPSGRRIAALCWHGYGHFFETLFSINPTAYVRTTGITGQDKYGHDIYGLLKVDVNGGNWQDRKIGSPARSIYYSQACDCLS